jgi:hypothetical protein
MPNGLALEFSHERVRATTRAAEVKDSPAAQPAPALHAEKGTRSPGGNPGRPFAKGNKGRQLRADKERELKGQTQGIASLNPTTAPVWLRPHVETGMPYILALLALLEGKPALHALAGDCADAHVMYRATLALATTAEDTRGRAKLMSEARGWLREHRTALATLCALAGALTLPEPDAAPPVGFVLTA